MYYFSSFFQKHFIIHLKVTCWAVIFSFNSKSTFNKITPLKGNRPTNLLGPILPKADTDSLLLQYLETLVLIEFPASLNSFYSFFSKTTLSSSLCSINSIGFLNSIFRKVKEEGEVDLCCKLTVFQSQFVVSEFFSLFWLRKRNQRSKQPLYTLFFDLSFLLKLEGQ